MKSSFQLITKRITWPALIATLVASGYIYVSPYLALNAFRVALASDEPNNAAQYIDFPSVRSSLRNQLKAGLSKKILNRQYNNKLTILGLALFNPLIDRVLDSTVTLPGFKLLFHHLPPKKNSRFSKDSYAPLSRLSELLELNLSMSDPDIDSYYRSYDRFITSSYLGNGKDRLVGVWQRKRFIHWRLISIELPESIWNN